MREYILKTWRDETSKPITRCIYYKIAYSLARSGFFYKAQIINPETGVIELEVK
jgi:hypothetical protein